MERIDQEHDFESNDGWIAWHCSLPHNGWLFEVDVRFILDKENLVYIQDNLSTRQILDFNDIMNMILNPRKPTEVDLAEKAFQDLYPHAEVVYGYIHARFIYTAQGLSLLREKYLLRFFGICPRALCNGQAMLPFSTSSQRGVGTMLIYCPTCCELYEMLPSNTSDIDGYILGGPSLPNALLKAFPELYPSVGRRTYIPKIFGFKIFGQPGSKYEYLYDKKGNCINQQEIDMFLEKPIPVPKLIQARFYTKKEIAFFENYGKIVAEQSKFSLPSSTAAL